MYNFNCCLLICNWSPASGARPSLRQYTREGSPKCHSQHTKAYSNVQAKLYIFSELNSLFSEDSNVGCFLGSVTSHLFSILGSHHLYLFSIVSIHSTSFKIRKNYWLMYIVGKCSIMIPLKGVSVTINHNVLYIHDEILAHCTDHKQPKN